MTNQQVSDSPEELIIVGSELKRKQRLSDRLGDDAETAVTETVVQTRARFFSEMISHLDHPPEAPVWFRFLAMHRALGFEPDQPGPPSCFSSTARPSLLIRRFLRIRYVLGMARITPDVLREAVQRWSPSGSRVHKELPGVLERYMHLLREEEVLDRPGQLEALLKRAKELDHLPEPFETVDTLNVEDLGFLRHLEFEILLELVQNVEGVELQFDYNPDREEAFAWVFPTLRKFERQGLNLNQVDPSLRPPENRSSHALDQIKEQIFRAPEELLELERIPADRSIRFLEASHPREEALNVAREVRECIENGIAPDEIAVVFRSNDTGYRRIIRVLREMDVPVCSRETGYTDFHPGVISFLLPVRVALKGLRSEEVSGLIRNRLLGGRADIQDGGIEELFREAGITGGDSETWKKRLNDLENALQQRIDAYESKHPDISFFPGTRDREERILSTLKKVREDVQRLVGELEEDRCFRSVLELVERMLETEHEFRIRSRLLETDLELNGQVESFQAVSVFRSFVHELYTGLQETEVCGRVRQPERALSYFSTIWEEYNRQRRSWTGPSDGVRVVEPQDLAGCTYKRVFMMSMIDGNWPKPVVDDPFLSGELIRHLREVRESSVLQTAAQKRDRELFLFYRALSSAVDGLVLSWSLYDGGGNEQMPSAYLKDVRKRLKEDQDRTDRPQTDVSGEVDGTGIVTRSDTERQVTETNDTAYRASGENQTETHDSNRRLSQVLERVRLEWRRQLFFSESDPEQRRARAGPWSGVVDGIERLRDLLDQTGFGIKQNRWTVSGLERFAQCPYAFFSERILDLEEWDESRIGLDRRKEGLLLHEIFRRIYDDWDSDGSSIDESFVEQQCDRMFERWSSYDFHGDPSFWDVNKERLRIRVKRIVRYLERNRTENRRSYQEVPFGSDHALPAVFSSVPDDEVPVIEGRIDRIDVSEEGRGTVIDYKNGRFSQSYRDALKMEEFGKRSFQIPVYLLASAQSEREPFRSIQDWSAGILALQEDRREPLRTVSARQDEDPEEWWEEIRKRVKNGAREIAKNVREGRFDVSPDPCRAGCPYRSMCRFEDLAPEEM